MNQELPIRYAWLAVIVAFLTLLTKSAAAWLTNSVGLFSDALESIVNLLTAITLVGLLRVAKSPPDSRHPYGHDKAEYFVNVVQGTLIIVAGGGIVVAALQRFLHPKPLHDGFEGMTLAVLAGLMNAALAALLYSRGKELNSGALRGEAAHLLTDVGTSLAVLLGVGMVFLTGIPWLDPAVALLMSIGIMLTGVRLLKESVIGLMDTALPESELVRLKQVLDDFCGHDGIAYHALRTRVSGARTFISLHVLVPGEWTVKRGHELLEELETILAQKFDGTTVLTHLEPIEEPCSFQDMELTRRSKEEAVD